VSGSPGTERRGAPPRDETRTPPRVATERLVLEPLGPEDADVLFAYRSRPEVSRFQGWTPSGRDDVRQFIDGLATTPFDTPGTWYQLAIRRADGDTLVGDVGVHFLEDGWQVEIGCTLAPEFQHTGYATEALRAVLDVLFRGLGKHRVIASIDPRNTPSVRLVERLGLRPEGHFRRAIWAHGEWTDDLRFAILRSEWMERHTA
jgi:RimJ/RimL family protein N-acetyltransferase